MTDRKSIIAFHLDLKTSHYRADYLKALFPRLAAIGYTHVVFEIEDKVRLESITGAEWHEAYSKSEFAGILAACRAAGLKPLPLIQTLGHLEFLLSHSRYHHLRELPATAYQLCPSRPDSVAFLKRWLDEVCELFAPLEFLHLGADETHYLGRCPACAERVQRESKSALYLDHLNTLAGHVLAKGVRPMAWADMVLAHPQALDRVSRDLVWVDWNYACGAGVPERVQIWGGGGSQDAAGARAHLAKNPGLPYEPYWFDAGGALRPWPHADFLRDQGFTVWIGPATRSHGDTCFMPRFAHLANVAGAAARLKADSPPAGVLVTSWALRLHTLEAQWPLLRSPQFVTQSAPDPGAVASAVAAAWLGQPLPGFAEAWEKLGTPLPHLHSYLGINSESYYYGPMDRLDLLASQWLASGFPGWGTLSPAEARSRTESILADYHAAHATLAAITAPAANGFAFWQFAARAQAVKARELLVALDMAAGTPDRAVAAALVLETEALQDEYRALLRGLYTPGSVERELDMIFAGGLRCLTLAAR